MVIITGSSRGIGKALVEAYLAEGEHVIGLSRSQSVQHTKHTYLQVDLSTDVEKAVDYFSALDFSREQEVTFIHNAGVLGEITPFGTSSFSDFTRVFQVNLFAGANLVHELLRRVPVDVKLTVVFISSGAGKNPIASWSAYCSSKAAVDMFCRSIALEQYELGVRRFRCFSISPGVVDTKMQEEIRDADPSLFSSLQRFVSYHETGELVSPELVAKKVLKILEMSEGKGVIYSVREINL